MAVKDTTEPKAELVDYANEPGFHVISNDDLLGTYETEEDAQAFIDGHLKPQSISAKIVNGSAD